MALSFRHLLVRSLLLVAGFASLLSAVRAADPVAPAAGTPITPTEKPSFIYRLTVTDRVRITIFQEDDLTEIVRVDAHGNVNLKLAGDLHIAGMTVNEAQAAIEAAYRDGRFLRNPQASVSVEDYAPRVPGFFLYFPERSRGVPKLRALIDLARAELAG